MSGKGTDSTWLIGGTRVEPFRGHKQAEINLNAPHIEHKDNYISALKTEATIINLNINDGESNINDALQSSLISSI